MTEKEKELVNLICDLNIWKCMFAYRFRHSCSLLWTLYLESYLRARVPFGYPAPQGVVFLLPGITSLAKGLLGNYFSPPCPQAEIPGSLRWGASRFPQPLCSIVQDSSSRAPPTGQNCQYEILAKTKLQSALTRCCWISEIFSCQITKTRL